MTAGKGGEPPCSRSESDPSILGPLSQSRSTPGNSIASQWPRTYTLLDDRVTVVDDLTDDSQFADLAAVTDHGLW